MTAAPAHEGGWIVCHLGAREHYATPRALARKGRLARTITDAWAPPGSIWRRLPGQRSKRLGERYHPELAETPVTHFTASLLMHEARWSMAGRSGWDLFTARNRWFQSRAAAAIEAQPNEPPAAVFAHSYAARDVFRAAKSRGWRCILGQIDPGEEHFRVVAAAAAAAPQFGPPPPAPPASYWADWREEWTLADRVVVNSEWSRASLERAGVPAHKLIVLPIAYEETDRATPHAYPAAFSPSRPLRVLFVGQVTVAKGIKALLDAMTLLAGAPVELMIVGGGDSGVPPEYRADPRIRFAGAVARSDVMRHYRESDVLVFPSLSDGFGMAQIEAHGWGLPIIASPFCGRVVTDGVDGLILSEVSGAAIADAIRTLIARPDLLFGFSRHASGAASSGITSLGAALIQLEAA